jgi:hypothetical protein
MAIGASFMLGVRLPANSLAYKATSIIEFWRRWHMTLSRFARLPLLPARWKSKGRARRYANLLITMALGGCARCRLDLLIWGVLHGLYLAINHGGDISNAPGTRNVHAALALVRRDPDFIAVVVAWVFFRATDLPTALTMLSAMAAPAQSVRRPILPGAFHRDPHADRVLCANSLEIMRQAKWLALPPRDEYSRRWLAAVARGEGNRPADGRGGIRVLMAMGDESKFLYFQF